MNWRWLVPPLLLTLLVLAAPLLAPYDPMLTDAAHALEPPGGAHPLGTDTLGRDVLSRVLYGGQRTLLVSTLAAATALLPGIALGLLSASTGARGDAIVMAVVNAWLAFPGLLLALVIMTLLGAGPLPVALATGAALIPQVARVTRSAALQVGAQPFVGAARAAGATGWWVTSRHLLPNIAPMVLAYAGVTFAYAMLNSAALTFLGLAGDIGVPDWGTMLYDARVTFRVAPWASLAPGLAITTMIYTINRAADRLLEAAG